MTLLWPVNPRSSPNRHAAHHGAVHDETLSRAVVTFIWGNRQQSWPSAHPDAVEEQFGERAVDLVPKVEALIAALHGRAHEFLHADLAITADRVEQALRHEHPELTAQAVRDLAASFTYTWK